MQVLDTNIPANRRQPVRLDGQDGPWSVSVAETPHDSRSYSLYIKTPTHNLTLTRTVLEILELDRKLRDSHPNSKIPTMPIDPASVPVPPKRKSNFLNTLSRLASPASNKNARSAAAARRENNASAALPTPPLTTPGTENSDPFMTVENPSVPSTTTPPSVTSTAIAAYLTTLSNAPDLRKDRVWKRFVRVRTDDLESVRVERAIKRVRSDLAAHVGGLAGANSRASVIGGVNGVSGADGKDGEGEKLDQPEEALPAPAEDAPALNGDDRSASEGAEDKGEGDPEHHEREATATPADAQANRLSGVKPNGRVDAASPLPDGAPQGQATSDRQEELVEEGRDGRATGPGTDESTVAAQGHTYVDHAQTPAASGTESSSSAAAAAAARLHRSQSVGHNKFNKLSPRPYTESTPSQDGLDGGMSSQVEETGDESSFSATAPRKRNRKKVAKKKSSRKVTIDDFEMIRVLGKGCAGKVLLVRHKTGTGLFALKAITKRHVLAHQELQHTLTEQAVLKRMAAESKDPFVVKLWWSFHDKENLFLVMDFHPGGDLATQLARWGRLSRDRTRFYAAEIVEGVEGLHAAGVIYRDLKPENILIAADGHIVLTDFGLSKEFARPHPATLAASGSHSSDFYSSAPGTPQSVMPPWMKPDKNGEMMYGWPGQPIGSPDVTTTFCGTAEYLAPEVIQGLPYGYEVDWWSFGTMLYEMLTGMTPFYANNHSDMYVRVLQDELQFPDDRVMDQDTKSLIRGLLQKNPDLRIREPRIKKHPYFSMIDWCHVYYKRYIPPYVPPVDRTVAYDTQNFDETFLDMEPVLDEYVDEGGQATDTDADPQTDTDRTDNETNTTPSQSRSSSVRPLTHTPPEEEEDESVDVFDGYSFKGRHSILMDDEDEEGEEGDSEEGDDDESVGVSVDDGKSSMLTGTSSTKSEGETIDEGEEEGEGEVQPDDGDGGAELEPKTPEARPAPLPPAEDVVVSPPQPAQTTPIYEDQSKPTRQDQRPKHLEVIIPKDVPTRSLEELLANVSAVETQLEKAEEDAKRVTIIAESKDKAANGRHTPPPKASGSRPTARGKPRREKSGVPALDKYLSDGGDDEPGMTELERDEEDEDWDFVEAVDGEDRNGAKGTSLWARGVVDRYRLAVFRKGSTPGTNGRSSSGTSSKTPQPSEVGDSPTPSQRRGRTSALNFRKHPRQFLRPKPPPSSFSNSTSRSFSATAYSLSAASGSGSGSATLLTPTQASGSGPFSPSLKSKESAVSMDGRSVSSDYSGNVISPSTPSAINGGTEAALVEEVQEKPAKNKKLKKYKNNAEKVFSLFSSNSSPRPAAS